MSEEEKKVVEYFKKSFTSKTPPYWYDDTIENSEIKIKTLVNLIEKLKKENEELRVQGSIILLDYNILKDKIEEKLKWYEDTCERLSKSGIELDMYDRYQGAIELCKELLGEE